MAHPFGYAFLDDIFRALGKQSTNKPCNAVWGLLDPFLCGLHGNSLSFHTSKATPRVGTSATAPRHYLFHLIDRR